MERCVPHLGTLGGGAGDIADERERRGNKGVNEWFCFSFFFFFFFDLIYDMVLCLPEVQKVSWSTGGKREGETSGERDTQTREFLRGSRAFCQILRVY